MSFESGLSSPLTRLADVSPHDDNDLSETTRALFVGVSGDVEVILKGDTDPIILKDLVAGVFHPLQVKRVRATGTAATDIVAGY